LLSVKRVEKPLFERPYEKKKEGNPREGKVKGPAKSQGAASVPNLAVVMHSFSNAGGP